MTMTMATTYNYKIVIPCLVCYEGFVFLYYFCVNVFKCVLSLLQMLKVKSSDAASQCKFVTEFRKEVFSIDDSVFYHKVCEI